MKNLLPLFVWSITNYFSNDTEITEWIALTAIDPSQLWTTASETVEPVDSNFLHPNFLQGNTPWAPLGQFKRFL